METREPDFRATKLPRCDCGGDRTGLHTVKCAEGNAQFEQWLNQPELNQNPEDKMGRYAKEPDGGDYEQAPEGTHLGVCFRIIDLGTQHDEFNGEERISNRIMISWELPSELMADGRPFAVSRFYTNSLHEKASLRKDLAAWRGRDFTPAELERFDLATILGKAALIGVGRTPKGKDKVTAVLAVPKGTPTPKATNPLQAFFLDEWDDAQFAALPKGIQRLIIRSDEYQQLKGIVPESEESWPDDEPREEEGTPF